MQANNISLTVILSIISTVGFLFLGLLQWRNSSKVGNADAAEKISNAYSGLLDDQNKKIQKLETRVSQLEQDLRLYVKWNSRLVQQVIELGETPVARETDPKMKALKKG